MNENEHALALVDELLARGSGASLYILGGGGVIVLDSESTAKAFFENGLKFVQRRKDLKGLTDKLAAETLAREAAEQRLAQLEHELAMLRQTAAVAQGAS